MSTRATHAREMGQVRPPSLTPAAAPLLQRKCACGGNSPGMDGACSACRHNRLGSAAPLAAEQTAESAFAPPLVHDALRTPGQPLDANTRAAMETRFGGADFGRVRVHSGARAAESARLIAARAYTVGSDIVLGDSAPDPQTPAGDRLLVHELAHVVQQSSVSSSSGPPPSLTLDRPGDTFEREADAVTETLTAPAHAAGPATAAPVTAAPLGRLNRLPIVQRDDLEGPAAPIPAAPSPVVPAKPAAPAAPAAPALPTVALGNFRNSGKTDAENECPLCPKDLGAAADGTNVMEMRGDVTGHVAGAQYDIKRTKERGTWKKAGAGAWSQITHVGPGADDDSHDDDEDLTPKSDHIFVIDTPGFGDIADPVGDAAATEAVYKATFIETVKVKVGTGAWTKSSNELEWHSITWLEKAAGAWKRKAGKNEIATGSTTVGTGDP